MNESLWHKESAFPTFPMLTHDIQTDVLIIGGGIAGLLCAYHLHQAGVPYILVEANTPCSGITENTTAKITAQHGMIYGKLARDAGQSIAQMYLDANLAALDEYRELCQNIPCHFEDRSNYVYSTDRPELEIEFDTLWALGYSARITDSVPVPIQNKGAIVFDHQAQFNPLAFLSQISKPLHIYTHTPVQALRGLTAVTKYGKITAKNIIIATHFPMLNKHGLYFMKMYQQRSYVLALENAQQVNGMYIGSTENSLSFRNYSDLLLLGGGGHRTGKPGGGWTALKDFALAHYPECRIKYQWATQDCMTLDGVPYIGQYGKHTPGLYVITGFNKWGMTNAMAGAMLLRDLICRDKNPYAELYSPNRSIWKTQLVANAAESASNLLHLSKPRCPHLGCALQWNKQEQTWDCPCHGSRFTKDGKLLDAPATSDLKKKPNTK